MGISRREGFGCEDDAPRHTLQQSHSPTAVNAGHNDIAKLRLNTRVD
jgi:hypothetical protein